LFSVQILKFAETASISKSRSPEVKSPLLMKMKKILLKPFPHSIQKKTHLSFAIFSFMMCQIYNTRNKKSRDHEEKTGKKELFSKDFVGGENVFFFIDGGLCIQRGLVGWGGKLKFVFFTKTG